MQYSVTFRHMEASDHLKEYGRDKLIRLEKYLDAVLDAEVVMTVEKFRHKAEVQLAGDYLNLTANEQSEDMYATVDLVLDKLEAQIKKHAEKLKEKRRGTAAAPLVETFVHDGRQRTIIGEDKFMSMPMHLDEAAMQLELLYEESLLVFLDAESNRINVLYRRKDGDFGLIDTGR